jgi:threonine dehydrogenase-like Zn-dependent dehydrogenase
MKAVCWTGTRQVEVKDVPEPTILNARDAIVRVTATAICGSDLHLFSHYVPTMRDGDILGHEFMGEVVETGPAVNNLSVGDRVIVPFPIACGRCNACARQLYSLCENANPNAGLAEKAWGRSPGAIYGYSHLIGGYAGGQAEFVRVPFADFGPVKVDRDGLPDERLLFLTDILPTGYMGAEMCDIKPGDIIAVWGAGSVGQFAALSAGLLGAERVIVIDRLPYRLDLANRYLGAEVINYDDTDVREALNDLTGGRGPDACIDAVGMEAHHGTPAIHAYDKAKQLARAQTDRPHALRQAITSCRNGGTVSVVGAYGGMVDKFPIGAVMNRSLTLRSGQCHVHRYLRPLLSRIQAGQIDPSFVITHRLPLAEAPAGYEIFKHKQDGCLKVVMYP